MHCYGLHLSANCLYPSFVLIAQDSTCCFSEPECHDRRRTRLKEMPMPRQSSNTPANSTGAPMIFASDRHCAEFVACSALSRSRALPCIDQQPVGVRRVRILEGRKD